MKKSPVVKSEARPRGGVRLPRSLRARLALPEIPRAERVFVNRNLRFSSLSAIGFDLDHTLAHYDPVPVEKLAFETTRDKLISGKSYPEAIRALRYDPSYVIRGLVVDRESGNILKMDYFNLVTRAFHGRQRMATAARRDAYRAQRFLLRQGSHVSVDTLFHLPEVYLFMCLVEYFEVKEGRCDLDYSGLYADVREMIDEAHRDGSLKKRILESPTEYIRRDSRLGPALDEFRRGGKKLFLLTNSELYYTDALMSFLLPPAETGRENWRAFFDLIVCDAAKPGFFLTQGDPRPPTLLEPGERVPAYSGGDANFLQEQLKASADRVLYFGDHTYGDILRSKRNLGWRTAMIVPELELEVTTTETMAVEFAELESLTDKRDRVELLRASAERHFRALALTQPGRSPRDAETRRRELELLRRTMGELRDQLAEYTTQIDILARKCSNAYNRHWGSVFREGNEATRFGHQIKDFACIYTSRVSNFLQYPSNFFFRSPLDPMPHEL